MPQSMNNNFITILNTVMFYVAEVFYSFSVFEILDFVWVGATVYSGALKTGFEHLVSSNTGQSCTFISCLVHALK